MKKENKLYFIATILLIIMQKINTVIAFFKNAENMTMTWLSWDTVQNIAQILLPLVLIYFVWKFFQMKEKFEEKDKRDTIVANAITQAQEDLFMMKTLMQIKYDKPDSYKMDLSKMKILDGIDSDVPKLYNQLIKKDVWGSTYTSPQILEKMSAFFNRNIIYSHDK